MKLVNRVMSEFVIKRWITLVGKQLDCAFLDRQNFEKQVQKIEREIKERNPSFKDVPDTPI